MAEEKKVLLSVSLNTDQFVQKVIQAKKVQKDFAEEGLRLAAEYKAAVEGGQTDAIEALTVAIEKNAAEQRAASTATRRAQNDLTNLQLATNAAAGSYEQVYQQLKVAENVLKQMEGTLKKNADGTVELTDEYIRQKQEVEKTRETLIAFNQGINNGALNVGNYTKSVVAALEQSDLFGGAIGKFQALFAGAQQGAQLFQQGVQLVNQGISQIPQGLTAFASGVNSSFTSATQAVGTFTTNLFKANKEGENVEKTSLAAQAAAKGMTLLTNATNIFKVALISTGIGAFLVAAGALVAFFTKTKEGSEKLAVALGFLRGLFSGFIDTFASAGKVLFDVISKPGDALKALINYAESIVVPYFKGLANVIGGIFTFDLDQIKEGFGGVQKAAGNAVEPFKKGAEFLAEAGTNAARVAQETAKITAERQKLTDEERKGKAALEGTKELIDAKLQKSKDTTLSEAERVGLIQEAGNLEKKYTEELIRLAQAKYDLKKKENELVNANAEALDEEANLLKELNKLKGEAAVLDQKVATEVTAIRKEAAAKARQAAQDNLNNEIAALNLRLEKERQAGEDTLKTRQDILAKQRDAELAGLEAGSKQAIKVRTNYELAVLQLEKEFQDQRKALTDQAIDAEIASILDGKTRELATLATAYQRELDQIKGNSEEANRLREALAVQNADAIRAIEDKYAQESLDKKTENLDKALATELEKINQGATAKLQALTLSGEQELNQLRIKQEQGLVSEEEVIQRTQEIEAEKALVEEQAIQSRLLAQQNYAATRKVNDELLYQDELENLNEQYANKELTEAQYNERKAELEKQRTERTQATESSTNQAITNEQLALDAKRLDSTLKTDKAQTDSRLRAVKAQKEANKQLLADTGNLINGLSELLGKDEAARKKNAGVLKSLARVQVLLSLYQEISNIMQGASKDTAKTGAFGGAAAYAVAAGLIAISTFKAFANLQAIDAQQFAKGGFTGGGGERNTLGNVLQTYNPEVAPAFGGGMVTRPTIWNLAGEKGAEYVAPAWQLRQAPEIFAMLDNWRTTKVRPFADGGFTSTMISNPLLDNAGMEQAIARGFASAPAPVVTVEDINIAQTRVNLVESRASI